MSATPARLPATHAGRDVESRGGGHDWSRVAETVAAGLAVGLLLTRPHWAMRLLSLMSTRRHWFDAH